MNKMILLLISGVFLMVAEKVFANAQISEQENPHTKQSLTTQSRTSDGATPQRQHSSDHAESFFQFPVQSKRLAPGKVTSRALNVHQLGQPMFILGDDEFSRAWLTTHKGKLKALGAIGLLVEVKTAEAYDTFKALAPGLSMTPVPGDVLAEHLGLEHYPVLISKRGIEQ